MVDEFEDRMKLNLITSKYFFDRNSDVASVLQGMGIKASVRTIQAWRMPPERKSSRRIPPGIISKLEDFINDPQNKSRIGSANCLENRFNNHHLFSEYIYDQQLVDIADKYIARDERIKNKWNSASLVSLPSVISDLEITLNREIYSFIIRNRVFDEAMRQSSDFQSFKKNYNAIADSKFNIEQEIQHTRTDIENNSEEFADSYGLLKSVQKFDE